MDLENQRGPDVTLDFDQNSRVKTPSRMRYEAEVIFLKRQNGSLNEIRQRLGLSRRKLCQLLMVDPSAWSRWTAPGNEAPPHIYRALDWYLSILEKDPEYRRLAVRFAEWLNHEKNHEGRLASLEALLRSSPAPRESKSRVREVAALCLTLVVGILLGVFALRGHI